MPDICIFYSEPDRSKVAKLSLILENLGWSIWWDKKIKSGRWPSEIESQIKLSRCVIPIWNSHGVRKDSITHNEAFMAKGLNKPMITLISEQVNLPLVFNSEQITADISNWDCNPNANCIEKIIESIESILGIAPKKWRGERPTTMNLLGKCIKLPCFVKSLSSHETQLDTEAGLTTLKLFPNLDAILISAYDMYLNDDLNVSATAKKRKEVSIRKMNKILNELDKRGVLILLDSGNYEKARKNDESWNQEKYYSVLGNITYTYAFCYDNLRPSVDPVINAKDTIKRVKTKYSSSIIPILHAPVDKKGIRNHKILPEIIFEYASREKESPVIAVPERELGNGICEKVKTLTKIREKLNSLNRYQPIHLLGTGNPFSIVILAAAGADLFDGLEWCRTVADRNSGFLFHHQQFDLFKSQAKDMARNEIVRDAVKDDNLGFNLKMAFHNLDFFEEWMNELQQSISANKVSEMLTYRAMFQSQDFVNDLKKELSGLFK